MHNAKASGEDFEAYSTAKSDNSCVKNQAFRDCNKNRNNQPKIFSDNDLLIDAIQNENGSLGIKIKVNPKVNLQSLVIKVPPKGKNVDVTFKTCVNEKENNYFNQIVDKARSKGFFIGNLE